MIGRSGESPVAASFEKERAFLTHYDREPDIPAALKALPVVKADILFVPGLVQGKQYNAALPLIKSKKDAYCYGWQLRK